MPYVTNVTPFQALGVEHRFYNGHPYDCLFVKATFRIGRDNRLLPLINQPKFIVNDVYEGDEETTALKYPSEIIPYKPSTDVIVVGSAKPQGGNPCEQWLANLRIARVEPTNAKPEQAEQRILLDKTIKLTGSRHWKHALIGGWQLSPIEPVSAVKLSYALSYGGSSHEVKKEDDVYWPNPFGRGFNGRNEIDRDRTYPAPQIFRPNDDEPKWEREFTPVGFSPVDGKQSARLQFAGTYDQAWKDKVAPNIPLDMKLDFWNVVPQDQVVKPYLDGGELVKTIGLFPTDNGSFEFAMPSYNVFAVPLKGFDKDDGMPMHIDTLTIDLDTKHVTVRWATLYSQQQGYEEYEVIAVERKTPQASAQ
jgi:hypothetical protein